MADDRMGELYKAYGELMIQREVIDSRILEIKKLIQNEFLKAEQARQQAGQDAKHGQ